MVAESKLNFHIGSIILFYYYVSCIFLPEEYNSARCQADYSFASEQLGQLCGYLKNFLMLN